MAFIVLQDSNGVLWEESILVVDGTPGWQATQVQFQNPQTIVLIADASNAYQLVVSTLGVIGTTRSQPPGQNFYLLGASDCQTGWNVTVDDSGDILLTQVIPWNPGPALGTLYPPDSTQGPYTQPGGPGTIVYPQQTLGEKIGLFSAGCSHWFNSWYVQSDLVCGEQSALVTCPLCGYIQQIITPYHLIYSEQYAYILG